MRIKLLALVTVLFLTNLINIHACVNTKLTRPIVIDIFCTLTTCCAELQFQTQQSICNPVFIRQSDVSDAFIGYAITTTGIYRLAEDIVYTGSGIAIGIQSSDIQLELACYKISTTSGAGGIATTPNLSNIEIRNGSIDGFSSVGVFISSGISKIQCDNISINNCENGILCGGTALAPITLLDITRCDFTFNQIGIFAFFINNSFIEDCTFRNQTFAGMGLISSFTNQVTNCIVQNTDTPSGSAFGIALAQGGRNIVKNCTISGMSSLSTATFMQPTLFGASITDVPNDQAVGILIDHEQQNKVEDNQVSNIITSSMASPYGIRMIYDVALTNTSVLGFIFDGDINSIKWSSDNRFLAVGGDTSIIRVFEFFNTTLNEVANFGTAGTTFALDWSPDRRYLAKGGSPEPAVKIFEFNQTSLDFIVGFTHGQLPVQGVEWSPDGKYIAYGGFISTSTISPSFDVGVLKFTGTALELVGSFIHGTVGSGVTSVAWSSDSRFLAIGGSTGFDTAQVRVLEFDGNSLDLRASFTHGSPIFSIAWSPDNHYVAIAGSPGFGGFDVRILQFDGSSLNSVTDYSSGAAGLFSGKWSSDGRHIIIGGGPGFGGFDVQMLQFTGSALFFVAGYTSGGFTITLNWMSNGQYIAQGGTTGTDGFRGHILNGLNFPGGSLIIHNTVSGINGPNSLNLEPTAPGISSGRGITASTGNNLVIGNTAFNNDINYIFVSTERFKEYLSNIRFRNEFPNRLSNVDMPPL